MKRTVDTPEMGAGMASVPVVGVDIGGTGIKGAPVDVARGKLAAERVRSLTPSPATPQAVADVVSQVLQQIGVPGPVGLTLPAVVRDGIVETASNIDPAWIGVDAVDLFLTATGRAVAVVNDADAAGIAEVRFGAGLDKAGVTAVITLGTGIGSALFVDGTLVPNCELGHLPGGVSENANKFLPKIELRTPIVPAQLLNDAGIIGAALSHRTRQLQPTSPPHPPPSRSRSCSDHYDDA